MAEDTKTVIGRYRDPADVKAALQRLERDGYAREDITLYTDRSNLDRIDEAQEIETKTEEGKRIDGEHGTDGSFWEKVKDMVSYDDPDAERAEDSSEADFIAPFREDIRNGYTVIAVKNYIEDTEEPTETRRQDVVENDAVDAAPAAENEKIQLKEEQLDVKKEEVQTGEVHIRKETVQDTEIIEVPVEREQIVVERRSVDETPSTKSDAKTSETDDDSESLTIPIKEEKIIVEKEPVIKEEVEIKKKREEDIETITEAVRREELDVDTTGEVERKDERDRRK